MNKNIFGFGARPILYNNENPATSHQHAGPPYGIEKPYTICSPTTCMW